MSTNQVTIIGGGLAGSEAAWQLAKRGIKVLLYEMRPKIMTPAHQTGLLGELVCSNSLRADSLDNAVGVLKEEMRMLDSIIIECADKTRVPAGGALAVDRNEFAKLITQRITTHPNIELVNEEIKQIPDNRPLIIATGPLTSSNLSSSIIEFTGAKHFHFFDAAAPIITRDSIDFEKVFWASRYDKGEAAYLNCPMEEHEYKKFYDYLVNAEVNKPKDFEKEIYFESCMPIEVMAKRGFKTLLFGPLKPVGLVNPKTNREPYAVVQLRKDNLDGTLFNMVGFQTSLKWGEQKELLKLIPGLEKAEIVRYGVIHKNTYINSPELLKPTYQLIKDNQIFFAGQITGVEGYVESAASGLVAGINCYNIIKNENPVNFPSTTAIGSLSNYITRVHTGVFQPMNVNFGLFSPLGKKIKDKKLKKSMLAERALSDLSKLLNKMEI